MAVRRRLGLKTQASNEVGNRCSPILRGAGVRMAPRRTVKNNTHSQSMFVLAVLDQELSTISSSTCQSLNGNAKHTFCCCPSFHRAHAFQQMSATLRCCACVLQSRMIDTLAMSVRRKKNVSYTAACLRVYRVTI